MVGRCLVMCLALLLATSASVRAQQGAIAGVVADAQGQVLPGVTVTLDAPAGPRVVTTSAEGSYRFEGIPVGTYGVRFERGGFKPLQVQAIVATAGQTVRADATLEISFVETVTVTTQRREESLQTVPVPVTALTTQALEKGGITDVSRLQVLTPGLNFGRLGEDARPAMRGARTENISAVNDPVIGFYVDGVFKGRFSQVNQSFVDVERVEVQRGPQGTLFGRNTFGGNVNVITNAPGREFDFGLGGVVGAYGRGKLEGFLNVPLGDRAQFRVAGMTERRDGYIKNDGPAPDIWDENLDFVRASLRLVPVDNLDLVARFTHWDQGGNGLGDFGLNSFGTLRDPATGRISLTGVLDPVSPRRGTLGAPLDAPYELSRDIALTRDNAENVGVLDATWWARGVQLKGITSFTRFSSFRQNDGDLSSSVHATEYVDEHLTSFTQEVQVASRDDARLRWVVGAYHLRDDLRYRFLFDRLTLDVDTDGDPETASAATALPNPGVDVRNLETQETTSNALFGQASFHLARRLGVTGGVRWTKDAKTYSLLNEITGQYNTGFQGVRVQDLHDTWTKVTWKGGVDYLASADHMVYASISTGFVAGGFAVVAPTLVYGPQKVTSYEVGSKNDFGGHTRLNLAAYYADYTDLLANAFVTLPGSGAFFTYQTNAGAVTSKGIEVELETVPVDRLSLHTIVALQDSTYGRFVLPNPFPRSSGPTLPGNLIDLAGTQVQQQPEARLSIGATYDIDLRRMGTLTPSVNTYYSSEFPVNDVVFGRDRVSIQEPYSKTDLRLSWTPKSGRFTVQAFVENLENEAVILRLVRGGDNILQGGYAAPRTWGVKVSVRHRAGTN